MSFPHKLRLLCRGDAAQIGASIEEREAPWWITCCLTIILGCGLYGAVVGWWRAPQQGLYTAIKLPLLILLTCAANALLNGGVIESVGDSSSAAELPRGVPESVLAQDAEAGHGPGVVP